MDYIQIQSVSMCAKLQWDKFLIKCLALILLFIWIENKTTIGLLSLCWAEQTTALRAKLGILYFCELWTATFRVGLLQIRDITIQFRITAQKLARLFLI